MRIALIHLCSFGDCLYATLVARQIKRDFPGSHLTWVIGDRYASVLDGNPDVDRVHSIPITSVLDACAEGWYRAREWVQAEVQAGRFDQVFLTQLFPENERWFDGLIRSALFRSYGRPVAGPFRPVVHLSRQEIARVTEFAKRHRLEGYRHVLLFECGPQAGQSPMTPERAAKLAAEITQNHPDRLVILSAAKAKGTGGAGVIDAAELSFRENAALAQHCTGLIGCSSGITWLTTSTASKPLPMLQILSEIGPFLGYARVAADFHRFGLDPQLAIELDTPTDEAIVRCVELWLTESHAHARRRYHQELKVTRKNSVAVYRRVRDRDGDWQAIKSLVRHLFVNRIMRPKDLFVMGLLCAHSTVRILGKFVLRTLGLRRSPAPTSR